MVDYFSSYADTLIDGEVRDVYCAGSVRDCEERLPARLESELGEPAVTPAHLERHSDWPVLAACADHGSLPQSRIHSLSSS